MGFTQVLRYVNPEGNLGHRIVILLCGLFGSSYELTTCQMVVAFYPAHLCCSHRVRALAQPAVGKLVDNIHIRNRIHSRSSPCCYHVSALQTVVHKEPFHTKSSFLYFTAPAFAGTSIFYHINLHKSIAFTQNPLLIDLDLVFHLL